MRTCRDDDSLIQNLCFRHSSKVVNPGLSLPICGVVTISASGLRCPRSCRRCWPIMDISNKLFTASFIIH
jgi:hypothetical protein